MAVEVVREGNLICLTGLTPDLQSGLSKLLTMRLIRQLRGKEALVRNSQVEIVYEPVYELAGDGQFITFAGMADKTLKWLSTRTEVTYKDDESLRMAVPALAVLEGVQLREAQWGSIETITAYREAQLQGPTGVGKSFLIKILCKLWPRERIVVCAQQAPVACSLQRELQDAFSEPIGMVGNGKRNEQRITVCMANPASLGKLSDPAKVDIMFYDEVHTAGAPSLFPALLKFRRARKYGFSATTESRGDGADMRVEALFGPVRYSYEFKAAVEEGALPPVEAYFYRLYLPDISTRYNNPHLRQKLLVWDNDLWARALHSVASHWAREIDNAQILVMSNASEHILRLKRKYFPDYTAIYRSAPDDDKVARMKKDGTVSDDFRALSAKERTSLIRQFEQGSLRRVVSTTTLGVGVNAPGLDVMIRADGGKSEISNVQFRGRVTRGLSGVYCDFLVEGDPWMQERSEARLASCKKDGWPIHIEELPKYE